MRLRKATLRGLTRFTSAEPVTIDLDAGGGGLIALVGRNGAGKTTALEATAAALFKALPSRPGSLYDHATGRDAFVEVLFDDGPDEIRVLVQIDAERRTTEGYIFINGASVTTGRAAEFETEILRRFGSWDLFLSSVFAAQNRAGNFLLATKGQRKALFAELLGLHRLEALHEIAKTHRNEAEAQLAGARAVADAATQEVQALEGARTARTDTQTIAEAAAGIVASLQAKEAVATAALERARAQELTLAALRDAVDGAERGVQAGQAALKDAQGQAARAETDAQRRRDALARRDPDALARLAKKRLDAALDQIQGRRHLLEAILKDEPETTKAIAALPGARAELAELEADEKAVGAATAALAAAQGEQRLAQQRLADANTAHARELASLQKRARLLGGEVPCTAKDQPKELAATCPLLAEARDAKQRAETAAVDPELVQAAEDAAKRVDDLTVARDQAVLAGDALRLAELRELVPGLEDQADRRERLQEAQEGLVALQGDVESAEATFREDAARAAKEHGEVETETLAIAKDLKTGKAVAAEKVAAAEREGAAARQRLEDANGRLGAAMRDVVRVPDAQADLRRAQQDRAEAEKALRSADQLFAMSAARVTALEEKASALVGLRDQVAGAEVEVGDWSLLERALGRDGVQALEIDAAGPEVARLTNELLEACYGPRFTVAFDTLREKKSERGAFTEVFDIKVYDAGHERQVEALSGGERVVVGEAIGLAIAIFNARKSGVRWETIFRDETAGALDPQNAQAYVEMLRRALALGGFAQVLFVAHQPEVWERADVRLVVEGGRIRADVGRAVSREAVAV